jgi:hypothetical protein
MAAPGKPGYSANRCASSALCPAMTMSIAELRTNCQIYDTVVLLSFAQIGFLSAFWLSPIRMTMVPQTSLKVCF